MGVQVAVYIRESEQSLVVLDSHFSAFLAKLTELDFSVIVLSGPSVSRKTLVNLNESLHTGVNSLHLNTNLVLISNHTDYSVADM
jgi:hypothetical protein